MAKEMKGNNQLIPPAGHPDVARRVFDILEQVVSDKLSLGLEDKWFRFYELGKNKHWRKQVPGLTLNSANLLSIHRRRTINTLTDNNPTFNVRRIVSTDDSENRFKMVTRSVEYWWSETEQQDILELSVFNGETYGVCIEKAIFDLDKEYGIGEVDTLTIDPFYYGIYPVKCLDIQKAQANLHYYPMSVREIKRKFGKAAAEVVADHEAANGLGDSRRMVSGVKETTPGGGSSSTTTIGGFLKKLSSSIIGSTTNTDGDDAIVVECWVKDYSIDEKTGEAIYPGFIRAITAVNGTIVLSDKPNPSINPNIDRSIASQTYLFDKFPFSKANSNKDPVNFWGECDFEQLAGLQMEFNKALSQFASLKDKVAGVKLINPKTSGVHNEKIVSGVSIINPETQNHGIGYLNPPPIPRELMESVTLYKDLFFTVAGTFDLEQANTPGSQVIAYKAIAALLERASTMMRGKIRNYGKLIRERGRMAVSLMQNWYTEDRYITFIEDGDEILATIRGLDLIVPMKLSVVSGSTMPRSDVQKREEALDLYSKGAIDAEELLKSLNWEKYDEVITRMAKGPVNQFIELLIMAGLPEEIAQYLSDIASYDEKKLERAVERHEISTFTETFNFEGMNPDVKQEIAVAKARAEVSESAARTEELLAKRDLTLAAIDKEIASIRQTDERIKNERAKIVQGRLVKEKELKVKSEEKKEKEVNNAAA
jgi:hypothetical protein